MKKVFFISLLLLIGLFNGVSQNPYYDAIALKKFYKNDGEIVCNKEVYGILAKYLNTTHPNEGQIENEFDGSPNKNPFIILAGGQKSEQPVNGNNSFFSKIGSLDVTNFADGLAKFMVERTKQELSIAFFERFKNDLDSIRQIQIIFPATYQALKAIDKEIYNYSAYLSLLRESFQKDMVLLIPNIKKLVEDPCMDIVFAKYPEIRVILSDGLFLVSEFSDGKHPGEAIHNYISIQARKESLDKINTNLYPALQTFDLFSQSLRSTQTDQYWISVDSLKILFNDDITQNLYLGLIYQQAKNANIAFGNNLFINILKNTKEIKDKYQPYIMELLSRGKNAGFYFKSIKEKQNAGKEKPTYQDYYSLYDASINFLEQLSKIPLPNSVNYDAKKFDNYFLAARSLGNIYVDVYEKQYTSAIVELSNVYSALLEDKADTLLMKIDHKESNTDKDKSGSDKKKLEKVKKASSMILKYGTFAATVAKAENSEEVKHAIEVVALPTGSSRIKRETSFNVSLNSYIGLFYGNEYIKGVKSKPFMNSYGVTAPVGVAFNMGGLHCCGHKAGHSLSVFVSLIDIGAIAAFRFQDDSTAALPKIELKDIISPGVFLSWGIAKSPISFSAGVQMGPLLRRVAPSVNTYGHNRYVRLSLSVAVDIPLLNLYTKPQ